MIKESVKSLEGYKPPLEGRRDFVRLDFNENVKGVSERVVESLMKIDKNVISSYPEYGKLSELIASYAKVRKDCVAPTNGGDGGIKLVFDTFVEKEDEVILLKPSFSLFKFYGQVAGAKIKEIEFCKNFEFPEKKLLEEISEKTKLIVLVNPNSPTGTTIKKKTIEKVLKKVKNAVVLVDEAYYEFYGSSCKNLVKKYSNLIVLRSFSKVFALAGVRIGYLITNEELVKVLKKVQSPYDISGIATVCVKAALEDKEYYENYISEIKKERKRVYEKIKELKFRPFKSGGNFLLVDFGKSKEYAIKRLREKGILIRNVAVENCARITIGTKKENDLLLKELEEISEEAVILFDLDGVLVEVSKSYRITIKKTAEYFLNQKIKPNEIQYWKNKGKYNNDWKLTAAVIRSKGKKVSFNKVVNKFQEFYLGKGKEINGLILKEKLIVKKKLLKELAEEYRFGIVTGRPRKEAEYILERLEVRNFFKVLVCMEDCKKAKPNPQPLLLALKQFRARKAIYLGDSVEDIQASVRGKMKGIGISSKQELQELFLEKGAEETLENVNLIKGVLG